MIERLVSQNSIIETPRVVEDFQGLAQVVETSNDQLTKRGWILDQCTLCGDAYYRKVKGQTESCNSFVCSGGYDFLNSLGKRNQRSRVTDVVSKFTDIFTNNGFQIHSPLNITNAVGNSIFVGNVGQIFDDHIFNSAPVEEHTNKIILQPVIRFQGQDLVGKVEGFTTSFVNIGSEKLMSNVDEHSKTVDLWMEFMSKVGLFMGDLALKPKIGQATWGTIDGIQTYTLRFNYKGLELGVGNYTLIPQGDRPTLSQSDLTFGLERILWAVNKNQHFNEVMGPFSYAMRDEDIKMDSYRTTTLMAGSGVKPGTDEKGSKLRSLVQRFGGVNEEFNPDLVKFYFDWWSQFTNLPNDIGVTTEILRAEVGRQRNVQMRSVLIDSGMQIKYPNTQIPTEIFVADLPDKAYDILRKELKNK